MANTSRVSVKTRNAEVQAGIDKHITTNVTIGGVTYTAADLKAIFQAQSAALDQAEALHKQWSDQVQSGKTVSQKANRTYLLLRSALVGLYGVDANAILNDFGMTVPKPTGPKTVQVKAVAAQKAKATRAARHTMGKVQKKAIHGTVPATAPEGSGAPAPQTPQAPQTTTPKTAI